MMNDVVGKALIFQGLSIFKINICMTWLCSKCHTKIRNDRAVCSWCGQPRPAPNQAEKEKEDHKNHFLEASIVKAVSKLNYQGKVRLWRWMEDNLI